MVHVSGGLPVPQSRYPIRLTDGARVELPHLSKLRELARYLSKVGHHASLTGDEATFLQSQQCTIHLVQSLEQEPVLVSQLVRIAILGIAQPPVEHYLNHNTASEETLKALQDLYHNAETNAYLMRGFVG